MSRIVDSIRSIFALYKLFGFFNSFKVYGILKRIEQDATAITYIEKSLKQSIVQANFRGDVEMKETSEYFLEFTRGFHEYKHGPI